jgi:PTS system nitrogen regulatory IIA component
MELKLTDVAKMLNISTKTVYRWVEGGLIPHYRVNKQYRFDQHQLEDWAASQGKVPKGVRAQSSRPMSLVDLIARGGIQYRVEGCTMINAILHGAPLFPDLGSVDPSVVLETLVLREEMQCTGVGDGLALPHARHPVITDSRYEFVAIHMLETPIEADSIDGVDIHTLIYVLCAEEIRHVRVMALIAHLCRQPDFSDALRRRALRSELTTIIHTHTT